MSELASNREELKILVDVPGKLAGLREKGDRQARLAAVLLTFAFKLDAQIHMACSGIAEDAYGDSEKYEALLRTLELS